ncbi:MAG: hypothetical protein KAH95_15970 [Spirochaetales bacterium]|nr:hypothetical protein [Spirochaetales bacterium]
MEIKQDNYTIEYKKKDRLVKMSGTLRLQDKDEYREIFELLTKAANETTGLPLTLDMKDLVFLNSSGISSLSLFIIKMRQLDKDISIKGSNTIPWQVKSLSNFQKLYGKVEIIFS